MTRLDFTQPPFDVLNANERERLKKQTQVRYLAKNECLEPNNSDFFYVVLKGRILQSIADEELHEFAATNFSNDWFDARKLPNSDSESDLNPINEASNADQIKPVLTHPSSSSSSSPSSSSSSNSSSSSSSSSSSNKSQSLAHSSAQAQLDNIYSTIKQGYTFLALEDSLLLQVDPGTIDTLSANNPKFKNLLSGELTERMQAYNQYGPRGFDVSPSDPQASLSAQPEAQQLLMQPVTTIPLIKASIIDENSSLVEAAKVMAATGHKHILVKRTPSEERHPTLSQMKDLGLLTETDICRAVSEQVDLGETCCHKYTEFRIQTVSHYQDISDALLIMIRHKVQRLPVLDDDQSVIGILGQSDLLTYLSHHSHIITLQIEQADSIERLFECVDLIGRYIRAQNNDGIKIGVISRIVQALNAQIFSKLWRLLVPDAVFENTCIIVMGSEGRGEQVMRTDQDNALIIRNGFSDPNISNYAESFNQKLSDMGYPSCKGNIMMTNPQWCKSLNRFKSDITLWFKLGEPEHGIWLSAIVDAAYVCGDQRLLDSLRQHLAVAHSNADPLMVRSFAKPALQFGDTNQWWKKFMPLIDKPLPQDIDLKKAGIFPLVHGIRAMALDNNIFSVTSTKARLQALAQAGVMTKKRAETLNEVLEFFMARRLDIALTTEDKFARQVDPTTLSALERDLLKECLNTVKGFKRELSQCYQLEI